MPSAPSRKGAPTTPPGARSIWRRSSGSWSKIPDPTLRSTCLLSGPPASRVQRSPAAAQGLRLRYRRLTRLLLSGCPWELAEANDHVRRYASRRWSIASISTIVFSGCLKNTRQSPTRRRRPPSGRTGSTSPTPASAYRSMAEMMRIRLRRSIRRRSRRPRAEKTTTGSPNAATFKELGRHRLTGRHPTPTHYASTVILMLDGSTSSVRASLDFASGMVSGPSLASPVMARSSGGEGGLTGGPTPAGFASSPLSNRTRAIGFVTRPAPADERRRIRGFVLV